MTGINLVTTLFLVFILAKLCKPDSLVITKQDIVHTTSGLILQYKSDYRPAEKVIALSTVIPMVVDMCYLIPISALNKIPRCNLTKHMTNFIFRDYIPMNKSQEMNKKHKRFLADIVSIGIGSAALSLATVNTIQTISLKNEVKAVTESLQTLQKMDYYRKAQILHVSEGQLKLAVELNNTQQALNRTMRLVNEHSERLRSHDEAIRRVGEFSVFVNSKLNAFMHAVEGQFLRSSIEDILRDKLNLNFIHHDDLPQVIEYIIKVTNITFDVNNSPMSLLDLVTRLLVRQDISFIPSSQLKTSAHGLVIGKLVFTSFFAASNYNEKPYLIYEPVPIPFIYRHKRVRLAQMPAYIGIHPDSLQFVRWSEKEAAACSFELMASCRLTPAIQKDLEDTCIYQILTDKPLAACRIEIFPEPVFVRRIGQYWAISTNASTKCHSVKVADSDQYKVVDSRQITLPPTALITSADSSSLSCDFFYLPGRQTQIGPKMVLYQNATVSPIEEDLIDLHSLIHNNTTAHSRIKRTSL